jgi:hypothetical protein
VQQLETVDIEHCAVRTVRSTSPIPQCSLEASGIHIDVAQHIDRVELITLIIIFRNEQWHLGSRQDEKDGGLNDGQDEQIASGEQYAQYDSEAGQSSYQSNGPSFATRDEYGRSSSSSSIIPQQLASLVPNTPRARSACPQHPQSMMILVTSCNTDRATHVTSDARRNTQPHSRLRFFTSHHPRNRTL